jgi:hypothetical protein
MRLSRDLMAMRRAPFGKIDGAAAFYESDVTFIFHFDENVTVALCKTKALIHIADSTGREELRSPRQAPSLFSARNRRIISIARTRACCTSKSARGAHDL